MLIDIGIMIKKVFKKAKSIDKIVYDMLNPADTNIVDMKINKYTMTINDKKLEKLYNYNYQNFSIVIFRRIFVQHFIIQVFIFFYSAFVTDKKDNVTEKSDLYEIMDISFTGTIFVIFLASFSEYFETRYYRLGIYTLFFVFIIHNIFDWLLEGYGVGMNMILFSIVTTFNLNLGNLNMFLLNVISCVNYIVKMVYEYNKEV